MTTALSMLKSYRLPSLRSKITPAASVAVQKMVNIEGYMALFEVSYHTDVTLWSTPGC